MTHFEKPSFSVAQRGRDPATCTHGWLDPRGKCVMCGELADVDSWMQVQEDAALRRAKGKP